MFSPLPKGKFGAIYADPPWHFETWAKNRGLRNNDTVKADRNASRHYDVMPTEDIATLQVSSVAAENSVLFLWITWPMMPEALNVIGAWGFSYKTCAFAWVKSDVSQIEMFPEYQDVFCGMGYWTRSNSEVCLLATRGEPKRVNADVRQGIIEPRREHSRKPECVYGRIERLVEGPYLELFARSTRPGWTSWGNQVGKFGEVA